MLLIALGALWLAAAIVVAATVLPLSRTNAWWVRACDFPRPQIALGGALVFVLAFVLPGPAPLAVPALMLFACGYQLWRIVPWTPLAATDLRFAPSGPDDVQILSVNVLMENERTDLVRDLIEREDPDILLLMEPDARWHAALEPVLARYPTVLARPLDNHYGMIFATRFDTRKAEFVDLAKDDAPSVFAELLDRKKTVFRFVGLHPRPPTLGFDTDDRDAQIHAAARFARKDGVPLIAAGDFNDVAWSDTSRSFKHVGEYLDPRRGRGFFASFDARRWWLRLPIDQIFVTEEVAVVALERRPRVGSDHFPMAATVRIDPDLAARLNDRPTALSEAERAIAARSDAETEERFRKI